MSSLGKRVSIKDCLPWVGLWTCLWGSLIDAGRPSGPWAAPFPRQGGSDLFKRRNQVQHKEA